MRWLLASLLLSFAVIVTAAQSPAAKPKNPVVENHQKDAQGESGKTGQQNKPPATVAPSGQPSQPNSQNKTNDCYGPTDDRVHKVNVVSQPHDPLYTAYIVLTLITGIAGIVTAIAVWKQMRSFIRGERAWVLVTIETAPQGLKVFEVIITNHGRTPARIVEAMGDLKEFDKPDEHLPEKPSYLTDMLPARKLVAPNENWIVRTIGVGIKNTEQIFYGYVAYRHIFDKPDDLHYTRFCYRLQPNTKWQVSGPPAYNDYT